MLLSRHLVATVLLLTTAPLTTARPVSSTPQPPPPPLSPPLPPPPTITTPTSRRQPRGATIKNVTLWPNGIVPFEIDDSMLPAKGNIRDAMNQFMQKTCVHFQPRTTETAYIRLTNLKDCFSSSIGYSGGMQVISLSVGCQSMGIITHELGHALGLIHEHTRSDSTLFVTIHKVNISRDWSIRSQFAISLDDKNLTVYDYDSIMHYGNTTFSSDSGKETITPVDDVRLLEPAYKSRLSMLDIIAVNELYNCSENKKKR